MGAGVGHLGGVHHGHVRIALGHEDLGAGVGENPLELPGGRRGVDGDGDGARGPDGQVYEDPFETRAGHEGHAVARLDARRDETGGDPIHAVHDLTVGDRLPARPREVLERDGARSVGGAPSCDGRDQIVARKGAIGGDGNLAHTAVRPFGNDDEECAPLSAQPWPPRQILTHFWGESA